MDDKDCHENCTGDYAKPLADDGFKCSSDCKYYIDL